MFTRLFHDGKLDGSDDTSQTSLVRCHQAQVVVAVGVVVGAIGERQVSPGETVGGVRESHVGAWHRVVLRREERYRWWLFLSADARGDSIGGYLHTQMGGDSVGGYFYTKMRSGNFCGGYFYIQM